MIKNFENLGLALELIEGLKKENIIEPTEIQEKVIPLILQNKDVIGESQTGSGKTLAYLLPLFERINCEKRETQVVILAPTHELSIQINSVIELLAKNSGIAVTSTPLIGEVNIDRQIVKLREKPHIVVGSSLRILELIKRKKINPQNIKTIVIDEGDKLLDQNNIAGVKDVIKTTLRDRQLLIFSATINEQTLSTARTLMKEPELIKVVTTIEKTENVEHIYILAEDREKVEVLRKLIASINPKRAIVFINKGFDVQLITSKLQYHSINACSIFGAASKEERKAAIEGIRSGKVNILISSDLSARGLDIDGLTHIINLDLPEDTKEYLHRAGRTGRMGKPGVVISVINQKQLPYLRKVSNAYKIGIEERIIIRGKIIKPISEK